MPRDLDSRADVLSQQLNDTLAALSGLPSALRQTITDHQWSSIPLFVSESIFVPAAAAGQVVPVTPQTSGLELIETVTTFAPAGGATVTLGSTIFPVPAGLASLPGLKLTIGTADLRQIVPVAGGNVLLWLCGQQLPTFGVLAR